MAIQGEGSAFELIRTPEGDRDAWLAVRKQGIGGSDVAAILGLSKYKGAFALWAEKSGLMEEPDISGKPAVEWGNILEPVVGDHYRALHPDREVRRVNAVCRSLSRPWAQASLDYEVKDQKLGWGVLEIKTVGLRSAGDWDDGVPVYYQTQVMHYLSVTKRPFADVAVLVGGQEYREYRLMRDEEDVAAVERAVDGFWARVQNGEPPEITGADSDSRAVFALNVDAGGEIRETDTCFELEDWLAAKAMKDIAEKKLKDATNKLKQAIGENKGIEVPEGKVVWSRFEATKTDTKAFENDHPGMLDAYRKKYTKDGGIRWYPRKVK